MHFQNPCTLLHCPLEFEVDLPAAEYCKVTAGQGLEGQSKIGQASQVSHQRAVEAATAARSIGRRGWEYVGQQLYR